MELAQTLKLLIFVEAYSVNGVAKSVFSFAEAVMSLRKSGDLGPIVISIAAFDRPTVDGGCSASAFLEAARAKGITVHVIPERYRFDSQVLRFFRDVVHQISPDIVQTNAVKSHFLMRATGAGRRIPWIAFHHGYTTTDFKMKCYNQLDRWSLPAADRVVTMCHAFGRQLTGLGVSPERLRVIHNSGNVMRDVSFGELQNLRQRLAIQKDAQILLTVGRLSREKGHADLVHAASWLRRMRPELKFNLILVGFGPERESLERLIGRLGLGSNILLACQEPDTAPFYRIANAFILPSHMEGSPHVIFEAVSAGLPIVATQVGGIPELLEDGKTAFLVPPRDPQALASSLIQVLESKEAARNFAENAMHVFRERFRPGASGRALLEVYLEMLRENSLTSSLPSLAPRIENHLSNGGDDLQNVLIRHGGIKGKRNNLPI
jgi:glycosyltransferase involved in cell wall biosynthesis